MKRIASAAALVIAGFSAAAAAEDSTIVSKPSVTVFHEFGNIVHGTDQAALEFNDYFLQRSGVWVNFKAVRNERLTLNATVGGIYWNPTYNENASSESFLRYFAAAAPRASATYAFGDPADPTVSVEAGMFPYKYNDHTHNLGEYLFRSTAYPTQVFTGGLTWVDVNRAQVTGVRVTHNAVPMFSHDAIVSFETDQLPYYDLNFTYMARAKVGKALKVNAGIQFARLLPVKPSVTNSDDFPHNRHFNFDGEDYILEADYYDQRLKTATSASDSARFNEGKALATELKTLVDGGMSMNSALDSMERAHPGASTNSSWDNYNMQSTKLAASFSFDPKALVGDLGLLGSQDLILYGEAALLGVKNYPVLYEDRLERTVAMIGFNVPTFRLLDVLAVEAEWFGSRQPNSSQVSQQTLVKNSPELLQPLPLPSIFNSQLPDGYDPEDWEKDNVKWSVFARRQLVKGYFLDAQVASDNARGWVYPSGRRYWAYFRSPSDWYWMMKLSVNI
jgi:hypothetical protein